MHLSFEANIAKENMQAFLAAAAKILNERLAKSPPSQEASPIRLLELGQLLFGHKTREMVCEPVIEELREDYLLARAKCLTPASVRWAKFCFSWRALVAFLGCFRVSCGGLIGRLVPMALKCWWTSLR